MIITTKFIPGCSQKQSALNSIGVRKLVNSKVRIPLTLCTVTFQILPNQLTLICFFTSTSHKLDKRAIYHVKGDGEAKVNRTGTRKI